MNFLVNYAKKKQPSIIVYEHTNYVNLKGRDMTSLFKLFGGIVALTYVFDFLKKVDYLPVNQVKELRSKVYNQEKEIKGLSYKVGRGHGWLYGLLEEKVERISNHQLDAFLIYQI